MITKKKSFLYKNPKNYLWGLNFNHGKNLAKRYEYISDLVGTNDNLNKERIILISEIA